jgi:hypothetical protein
MRQKVELATREFAAVAVNGGFQLRHELHELERLPDLNEQRVAFEQRIHAESGRYGFAQPFHGFGAVGLGGVNAAM